MSTNSELTQLNVTLTGQDQMLPDRGVSVGFLASSGMDCSVDATNGMGSIAGDTGSDMDAGKYTGTARGYGCGDYNMTANGAKDGTRCNGSMGGFSAGSDAPGEENVNDDDVGDMERANYA